MEKNKLVDIIAEVSKMNPIENRQLKGGEKKEMRNIIVRDTTAEIQVTFWGESVQVLNDV